MRTVLLAVALAMLARAAWGEDMPGQVEYREAFYENALVTLRQLLSSSPEYVAVTSEQREAAISKIANGFTECHMQAMAAYSIDIQGAAYRIVGDGGSYPEAHQALNLAIASEGAAGGEREEAVKAMFATAAAIGQECLQRVKESNPFESE
jgi:hypothetical protein